MAIAESLASSAPATRGSGHINFVATGGRTLATRATATSPLRLLAPRNAGHAAWVFTSSFGGGLLAGDHLSLDINAGAASTCYIGSQSSTKIYRSANGRTSRQSITARVGENAVLVVTPDPVVCFRGALYSQKQQFEVAASGGLVLLDWFTSGRHACGERWEGTRFESRNEIILGNRRVLADNLRLDPASGSIAHPLRMGQFNCFATLLLIGQRLTTVGRGILSEMAALPVRRKETLLVGASPLADGVILRLACAGVEQATGFLFQKLAFLAELLGEHPWLRKW